MVVTAVIGVIWGQRLRRTRPEVYRGISEGRPDVHAVPDDIQIKF